MKLKPLLNKWYFLGALGALVLTGCAQPQYYEDTEGNFYVEDPRGDLYARKPATRASRRYDPIPQRIGEYCPYNTKTIEIFQKNGYGEFIACEDQTIVLNGRISSGKPKKYTTPTGTFRVWQKHFEHDSTVYPSEDGSRNMDRALYFNRAIAIHKGNPRARSHGCVHVGSRNAEYLYEWADIGTKVIVTNGTNGTL